MELMHGTLKHKASKFASEDAISNMPDIVITNILDRLSLRDAVRTSVLSTNWMFKWTMLSQLEFNLRFFDLLKTQGKNNHVRVIGRILLHLRGTITKFVLSVYDVLDNEDINHWILFLSRKGINDLTLQNWNATPLKLPTRLFSCLELKHLKLRNCYFNNPPPSFQGFSNLLSLDLCVKFEENVKLGEFFTGCPLLEKLTMDNVYEEGKVRAAEISKLQNLKVLSLKMYDLDDNFFELLRSLPKLQELDLYLLECQVRFIEDGAKKRSGSPTTFPCLKTLTLSDIDLGNDLMLSCAFEMIKSFPNLQTLEITADDDWEAYRTPEVCSLDVDYNTVGLLHLQSVVFTYLTTSENELCLIKYLLACSPFLKKMVIHPVSSLESDKKFMFARKLVKLHRASPDVDIDLH